MSKDCEEPIVVKASYPDEVELPPKKRKSTRVSVTDLENPVEKPKKEKKKFSSWFLTLSPNVPFVDDKDLT